ncbi:MAG: tRNA uridine-5-carboxymethylaminomethyl(34) synthesis GTPase MnmE [Kiritimatiellae bacterium]|nr:tRNA uridine-5-carboxymethylaminomethyl(34) synthesis GTPase MnmE [Kiritimatiellia bacterium]
MSTSDTIAAIATAPGRGGVAVVRVSGPDAWEVARKVTKREIDSADAGRFFYCSFLDPAGHAVDSGLMLVFKSPSSYTGENVIEFHGHGGSVAPRRVLESCFAAGARLARRGEFTERAFLNGKLDLSAAEAVIDLVDARTDRAADDAQARLQGMLSGRYESLYRDMVDISSRMEYLLDVDEGDIPDGTIEGYCEDVNNLKTRIAKLLSTAREGKILREGALVVLAGAPNAGKSSLMNALLGEKRAIVSDIAGTTRDSIEEGLDIDGWPIRLVDTAGLRVTDDAIEAEGVDRAEALVSKADIVVALDCDIPGSILLHAKCDLDGPDTNVPPNAICVSSATGEGLQRLKNALSERLKELSATVSEGNADVTARQSDLLRKALSVLDNIDPMDVVLAANGLRNATQFIGEIIGKTYSEDLLEALFSRFCVGK